MHNKKLYLLKLGVIKKNVKLGFFGTPSVKDIRKKLAPVKMFFPVWDELWTLNQKESKSPLELVLYRLLLKMSL